jgi:hypothetical protein
LNYLTEINAFNEWLETHPLDATTQALWYHLMAIANKCGWPEWFTVANATLQAKLGVDKKTVIRHRTILQKVARITYKNGSTRQAGKYLLHAFSGGISGKFPPIKGPITDQSGNQSRDHYINKTKTKLNKEDNNIPPRFPDDSTEMFLAIKLRDHILRNNERAKVPADLSGWAGEFDKMIRIDKKPVEQIEAVIRHSQEDSFWQSNILSAKKLREKFDTLYLQSKNGRGQTTRQPTGNTQRLPRAYESLKQFAEEGD